MGQPGTIRRALLIVLTVGGSAVIATVIHDFYMLRGEAEAVAAGRINQAADYIQRIKLLKNTAAAKVRAQLPAVAASDRRFPRELPLVEALLKLTDDPAIAARRASLRVLLAGPETLDLTAAEVQLGNPLPAEAPLGDVPSPPPAPPPSGHPEPLLIAEPNPSLPPSPWGHPYLLKRLNMAGAVIPLGDGLAGGLGRSWAVSPDGRVAVLARPAERALERWDLVKSQAHGMVAPGPAAYVALRPMSAVRAFAFTVAENPEAREPRSEVLYRSDGTTMQRLFPPTGQTVGAIGFAWAPDGRSLLVRYRDRPVVPPGELTTCLWITEAGHELTRTVFDAADAAAPRWVIGPGAHMGLIAGGESWAWDGRARRAQPLAKVRGEWGFSPDGRLIAGLDVGYVFVALEAEPTRRMDHKVPELPPYFSLSPDGFSWTADGLHFTGRTAKHESGPWRAATVNVKLIARE